MTAIEKLLDIMARLRDPETGCPWDREQTFATIAPHTIEEAYEVFQTIADGDMAGLCDELGDLLFQIVFYAQMAKERAVFDFDDVAGEICAKMVRRHPHVFGDARIESADAQTENWEQLKARERAEKSKGATASALDGVAAALPALARAQKLQKRAARVGFDWPELAPVFDKLDEEIGEIKDALEADAENDVVAGELGDVLFACVNLARRLNVDAEAALRETNAKFERRFSHVEAFLGRRGQSPETATLAEMEQGWQDAKRSERK